MPKQEIFFERHVGDRRVEVLKTYDPAYAREVLDRMDQGAQSDLWNALGIDRNCDPSDVPMRRDPDIGDFLWEEMSDAAREDWNSVSFFVVNEENAGRSESLYVSPDWPSAEAFAKNRIAAVQQA
jgi:hypothetical protein